MKSRTLTNEEGHSRRCERCELPLYNSIWKAQYVVLFKGAKKSSGFYCVKCMQSQNYSNPIPSEILDDFVLNNPFKISEDRQRKFKQKFGVPFPA